MLDLIFSSSMKSISSGISSIFSSAWASFNFSTKAKLSIYIIPLEFDVLYILPLNGIIV